MAGGGRGAWGGMSDRARGWEAREKGLGVTHSLVVGTNCETTAPTCWQWTSPGFPMSKFTAPSFHAQGHPTLNQQV